MNAPDATLPPVHGRVDRQGRLVEADPRLLELNEAAGGALGEPIAVPQIARLAWLATRLGILISRGVIAAWGDDDLELWVRARPEADGVRLAISGWRTRPGWTPPGNDPARDADLARAGADWCWEADGRLRFTHLPLTAGARHGFDAAALLGRPLTELFVLEAAAAAAFPMLGAISLRQAFRDQPATLLPRGQKVLLSAAPRLGSDGTFTGYAGAVQLVEAVPAASVPAAGLPAAFAARLDRALRGPLGRIVANADSISAQSEGPLTQDYVDYAADIANAGRHLLGLIDDLVDLQAIERPDFQVAAESIDLADVARRAAGLLGVRASASGVRIDRPKPDETLPAIGEFRRALQVLVNLVGNAVRYSPEGGMVWIRCEREGGVAAVIVADQGRGIATEDQARIFEKFERVDAGEPGGSGLGLYISQRLARAMGGDITVDSAPGQGARFVLTLPSPGPLSAAD